MQMVQRRAREPRTSRCGGTGVRPWTHAQDARATSLLLISTRFVNHTAT